MGEGFFGAFALFSVFLRHSLNAQGKGALGGKQQAQGEGFLRVWKGALIFGNRQCFGEPV